MPIHIYSVTLTFTQGIRNPNFPLTPLNHSNTLTSPPVPALTTPAPAVLLPKPCIAILARLPSVELIALAAKFVAPSTILVSVALEPRTEEVVAVMAGCQRSSNQFPEKSKREQVRMRRRMLQ